jgi:hypothetical protein
MRLLWSRLATLVVLVIVLGACSSSAASPTAAPTPRPAPTLPPPTDAPTPSATPATTPSPTPFSLTGQWNGTWQDTSPDHSSGKFTLTLIQTGPNLAGTILIKGSPCLADGTVSGTANNNAISFGAVSGKVKVSYSGTLSGLAIKGTYSAPVCYHAKGTWAATKG